ncbi:MAG: isochorismatase family protein [Actinomycetes bacterium]
MTTLPGRPRTALLVIDAQQQVMSNVHARDAVIGNIGKLLDRARSEHVPVVWVQDNGDGLPLGSEGWRLVPELVPAEGEALVNKQYADSFEETDLEEVLSDLAVGRLIVSGAQTDECIRSTLHGAVVRGYDATLVSDAHSTEDFSEWGAPTPDKVIAHTNLYWSSHAAPGRQAGTVTTDAVDFSPASSRES